MTYPATQVSDFADSAILRFLEQFKGKPELEKLARSYLNRVQELEDAIWEVILIRGIDASGGQGLDAIGATVGRRRLGLIDSDYRIALRAQIRINRSAGTPEDLIAVAILSLPAGYTFTFEELTIATVRVNVQSASGVDFNIRVLFDNLNHTRAAGVRLLLTYLPAAPDHCFQFASGSVVETDPVQGFGDSTDATIGGELIGELATSN